MLMVVDEFVASLSAARQLLLLPSSWRGYKDKRLVYFFSRPLIF